MRKSKKTEAGKGKNPKVRAIVYLSVDADERNVDWKEKKQLRYIREYAQAHNIEIVKILHRSILGEDIINRHLKQIIADISDKEANAVLVSKMSVIATDVEDAYKKIGMVVQAGGKVITVDEGKLTLPIKM